MTVPRPWPPLLWICLCSLVLGAVPLALAQESACGLVRAQHRGGLLPQLPAATDIALHETVRSGYETFYRLHDHATAKRIFTETRQKAAQTQNACAEALSVFGLGLIAESDDFEHAGDFMNSALAQFSSLHSPLGVAQSQHYLSVIAYRKGDIERASAYSEAAAQIFRKSGDLTGALQMEMGIETNKNSQALRRMLDEAKAHSLTCVQGQIQQLWTDVLYPSQNFREALEHAQEADALYAQCPAYKSSRASLQTSMGRMERLQGRPRQSLRHYRIALSLQKQSGDLSYIPQTYNAMAVAYETDGNLPAAIARLDHALAAARAIHSQPFIDFISANLGSTLARSGQRARGISLLESSTRNLPNDYLRCVRLSQLADAYQGAKLYQKALATYQISLPACRGQKNTEATLNALDGSASAELALGRYDDALHDSQEALALIESIRKQLVQKDAYKQGYLEQTLDMYNTAIDALTALGRATEALETAEQARSRALLDLLGTHSAALPASHAVSASDDASLLESSTQAPPASMKDIVDSLQRLHSTLLAYWSSQTSLHIWVVTEKGEVFQATRKITPRQISSMQGHRRLYRELIEPMKEHLPKGDNELLTIVPSGPLFNISFAALQGPNGKYLVEQYRTHVLPSIGLLRFTSRNAAESERQNERYVLLADPASPPDRLPSLPSTRVEATAIARILPPAQTSLLLGAEANRRQLLDNISSATVLHMATHAVLNEKDSYQSFLALQSGRTDTGKLTVADIYQWKLHSRLVVLSACRSGLGRITGDGIAGLNRALFYAGAASVLSSMWDIADKPTAEMLPRFYQALLTGTSPSGALRQAQLSMLSDLRKGRIHVRTIGASSALPPDPVYWAAFSLAGEP